MADALRELLAEFTIAFDREGNLARGNQQVDGLKAKLEGLQGVLRQPIPAPKMALPVVPTGGLRGAAASFREGFNNSSGLSGFTSRVLSLRGALIGLGAGAVIGGMSHVVNQLGDIGEQAARLGVSTDEFQRLDILAKQNATSVGALGTAFRTLANNAVDPTKESAAAFAQLGVTTRQADGTFKSRNDLFFETAGALADISDGTLRAQLAQKLYGRSAIELLPLLSQGREGLEAQREQLAKLAVVSGDTIKAADELADKWVVMRMQLLAAGEPVIKRVLIPLLEGATEALVGLTSSIGGFLKQVGPMRVGLVAGAVALSRWIGPITTLTNANFARTLAGWLGGASKVVFQFAKLAAAFLIIEDVVGFFQGKDSATGALMTAIFGEDGGKQIQQAAIDILDALKELFGFVQNNSIMKLASDVGEAFSYLTGTESTQDMRARGRTEQRGLYAEQVRTMQLQGAPELVPLAPGQFGPPAANYGGASVTVGDTVVTVNGVDPNNAPAVARAVKGELEGSRNRTIATYTSPGSILR